MEDNMFVGRKKELSILNKLYSSNRFEFAVIYGRRRVGKTALINEFVKDKEVIFFTGVESNEKQNLYNFSRCIIESTSPIVSDLSFSSYQAALEYIFESAKSKRIVLVIDEYPYVAKSSKSFASTLQLLIDKNKGRRTAQLKIEPFDFFEVCDYLKGYSIYDKVLLYGIIGGTPQYLTMINDQLSVEDNIKAIYLDPTSFIFEEPSNLLKQEVREPAIYNAIISAIATGATKMNEIADKVGEDTGVCAAYIKNLISLGIVKKEMPYGENKSRKTIYSIEDNMFRFWYRFIPENISIISHGLTDLAMKKITSGFSTYMGGVFEDICKQYLWKALKEGKTEVGFKNIGRWWGTNPKTRAQEEIDIMGEDLLENSALFAECKWTNEKVDLNILETLIKRSDLFHYKQKYYYLFSKSGFTKGCIEEAAKKENIRLIKYEELFSL